MKKLQKLQKEFDKLTEQVSKVSFERRDTSYRRSGGYFGTTPAQTSDVIIVRSYARTKHLNGYSLPIVGQKADKNQLNFCPILARWCYKIVYFLRFLRGF